MERYKEYKDSGLSWLPQIPINWEVKRVKNVLKDINEISETGKELQLSVTQAYGIIKSSEANVANPANTTIGWKKAIKGDIVFNKFKAHSGVFFVTPYDGIVTFNYCVYRCYNNDFPKYLEYLFKTPLCITEFIKLMKGVGGSISPLYTKELFSIHIPLPSPILQKNIVNFLDSKTSKIDTYISEKEKEIQLLNELKEAEITKVVTQGLNPNVKIKKYASLITTSYPEYWNVVRNKSIMSLTGEKVGNRADEYTLLSLTTKGIIVRDVDSGKGKFPKDFDTYQFVKKGELVFCLFDIDETPRTVGLVDREGMLTGAYTALKVNRKIALPEYIYNYYLCVDNIKALKPYYSGLRKTVRADKFLQIYLPLPPIEEQQAIVAYINEKTAKVESLISELQAEIEHLKEYKQRLIADCVTGQVNVQNI